MTDGQETGDSRDQPRGRPLRVAEDIRRWFADRGLRAGDPIPDDRVFVEYLGMSRSTVGQAIVILEAQGFVESRSGADAGRYVGSLTGERAQALLSDHLVLSDLSLTAIYQIRRLLEPDLVAELAGRLPDDLLDELDATVDAGSEARTPEEKRDRQLAALGLHARLAREAGNPLLGALVACLARGLAELTVSQDRVLPPDTVFLWKGDDYRRRLIDALRYGDARAARRIMLDHLETTLHLAGEAEARAVRRLIAE